MIPLQELLFDVDYQTFKKYIKSSDLNNLTLEIVRHVPKYKLTYLVITFKNYEFLELLNEYSLEIKDPIYFSLTKKYSKKDKVYNYPDFFFDIIQYREDFFTEINDICKISNEELKKEIINRIGVNKFYVKAFNEGKFDFCRYMITNFTPNIAAVNYTKLSLQELTILDVFYQFEYRGKLSYQLYDFDYNPYFLWNFKEKKNIIWHVIKEAIEKDNLKFYNICSEILGNVCLCYYIVYYNAESIITNHVKDKCFLNHIFYQAVYQENSRVFRMISDKINYLDIIKIFCREYEFIDKFKGTRKDALYTKNKELIIYNNNLILDKSKIPFLLNRTRDISALRNEKKFLDKISNENMFNDINRKIFTKKVKK